MLDSAFVLMTVVLTSGLALLFGLRLGLQPGCLRWAARHTIRVVGSGLLFWAFNVGLGAAVVLLVRALGIGFVSIYLTTDTSILILSVIQAIVFESWRAKSRALSDSGESPTS